MDPLKNPFNPGAGTRPPELAGRDKILEDAAVTLGRLATGKQDKSQLLLGLRGVGKTVLLNEIADLATKNKLENAFTEAPENRKFLEKFVPQLRKVLLKIDRTTKVKAALNEARVAIRNFASVFKLKLGDIEMGVTPEAGVADSGDLSSDLTDLLVATAKAAKSANTGVVLLVDEVQYLTSDELSSLIVAMHRVAQLGLPLTLFGAGLPQLAALAGDAKSYAERLFDYPEIGPLKKPDAINAIADPIKEAKAGIESAALNKIYKVTEGYPFFLQEWGKHSWNAATGKTITAADVTAATKTAIASLDKGFFKVRLDRLTPRELDYMRAMAGLGAGPHGSGEIATAMGQSVSSVGPIRGDLIAKGMIYSPSYGKTAFTVPMFDAYVRRAILNLEPSRPKRTIAKKKKA